MSITTAGSGNWSSTTANAPWPGGTLPTSADDVIIANTHTVTLDVTTAVCNSLTINAGGTLQNHASNNMKLLMQDGFKTNAYAGGVHATLTMDVSGSPTQTCSLLCNNARHADPSSSTAYGFTFNDGTNVTLKGYPRKRWTTLTAGVAIGATSCAVADATGWQTGDRLLFGTTQAYSWPPKIDDRSGTNTISGLNVTNLTALTYAHASGGPVGNMTSNLILGAANAGDYFPVAFVSTTGTFANIVSITDVLWQTLNANYPYYGLNIQGGSIGYGGVGVSQYKQIANCIFDDHRFSALFIAYQYLPLPRNNNIYNAPNVSNFSAPLGSNSGVAIGIEDSSIIFQCGGYGIVSMPSGSGYSNSVIAGTKYSAIASQGNFAWQFTNCDIYSCNGGLAQSNGSLTFNNCRLGTQFGGAATIANAILYNPNYCPTTMTNCSFQSSPWESGTNYSSPGHYVSIVNKNNDVTKQEYYTQGGIIVRDNANVSRSTSSVSITPRNTAGQNVTYSFTLPVANGASIEIVGSCKATTAFYNGGGSGWTAPTVTISDATGNVLATYTATSAANNAWEKYDLTATNSSGADSNLTVTYTVNAKTSSNFAAVYFDGVPTNSPYVTKARHYGYQFDQTLPNAIVNGNVVASEATAAAYTGISVSGGATNSPVTVTASTTFQKLYDYTQAWSCLNLGYAVPIGATSPGALAAAANLTINTGQVINGAGAILMGSYTLTTEFSGPLAYTYTGGTWSQLTSVPNFSGGTLTLGAEQTYTFTASAPIISFAPSTNGVTYNLGGGTFSGTLDLRNANAHTMTVQLPSGTTYTTANNSGGTITVTTPAIYQSVTISGPTVGSRIQIYDTTHSIELYNGTPSFPYTWTDTNPASATRAIRLRVAYCTSSTANQFIDTSIGTCGTSVPSNAVSYLVSPVVDSVYVNNMINGTAISDCSISGSTLHVDINAGTTNWPHIYAFMVYWLSTSGGIKDQFIEMTATDQTHYVFATAHGSFKIKNVTSGPTVPLLVTGGNAKPDSGSVTDILDTTGGSIFCIEDTVVPYNYVTSDQSVNLATVQQGLTNQGYTTTRAPYLDRIDTTVSSRLATSGYTAPGNSDITAIKAKTDNLGFTVSGQVDSNIKYVNGTLIKGNGSLSTPWGP